jgi:hypothetical protein
MHANHEEHNSSNRPNGKMKQKKMNMRVNKMAKDVRGLLEAIIRSAKKVNLDTLEKNRRVSSSYLRIRFLLQDFVCIKAQPSNS